jgi:DNA-directed RNA polymerase subunit beta'
VYLLQKESLVNDANKEVEKADNEYRKGIITNEERIEKSNRNLDKRQMIVITDSMFKELEKDKDGFQSCLRHGGIRCYEDLNNRFVS